MKDELDRRADQVYFERAELMAELAFENPDSLDVVSSTLEITPQETELVTKKQLVNEFRIPSVLKIFNDDVLVNRYNSEPVETPDDNIFIFRVKKHEKATIPEFKNVQEQVKQDFIETQLKEATIELAEAMITELRESWGQSALFQNKQLSWKTNKSIGRYSDMLPFNVRNKAFAVELKNNNPHYFQIQYDDSTIAIVKVQNQQMPAVSEADENELNSTRDFIVRPRSAVMWKDYLKLLRNEKKIKIYNSNLSP